jgi:hypothetical protein
MVGVQVFKLSLAEGSCLDAATYIFSRHVGRVLQTRRCLHETWRLRSASSSFKLDRALNKDHPLDTSLNSTTARK